MDIESYFVIPPYLHILLGITNKHQKLLENEVHKIDCLLLKQEDSSETAKGEKLKYYGSSWKQSKEAKKTIQE